jgi:hypothetical protein
VTHYYGARLPQLDGGGIHFGPGSSLDRGKSMTSVIAMAGRNEIVIGADGISPIGDDDGQYIIESQEAASRIWMKVRSNSYRRLRSELEKESESYSLKTFLLSKEKPQ